VSDARGGVKKSRYDSAAPSRGAVRSSARMATRVAVS
jgi:hypothetical protein